MKAMKYDYIKFTLDDGTDEVLDVVDDIFNLNDENEVKELKGILDALANEGYYITDIGDGVDEFDGIYRTLVVYAELGEEQSNIDAGRITQILEEGLNND